MTTAQRLANMSQDYGVIPMSNRNYCIDGAMEYVFGGNTALSGNAGTYTCNAMWKGSAGTGGVATVSNGNIRGNADLTGFDTAPNGCYVHQQSTASTGSLATLDLPLIYHFIEGVNKFAGRSVTLSAKIWVTSGGCTIPAVAATQDFGTGGSPSAMIRLDKAVNWVIGTAAKRFSVRLDFPNLNGKTLGTNNNDKVQIGIWFPAGWTGTLNISEVQVELSNPLSSSDINGAGGEPTAFEYRGQALELVRAQRLFYFFSVNQYQGNYPAAFYSTTGGYAKMPIPVPMRASPAGAMTGSPTWYCITNGGGGTLTAVQFSWAHDADMCFSITGTSLTLGMNMISNSAASPAVFSLDARL